MQDDARLITESGEEVAVRDLALGGPRPFSYKPGPNCGPASGPDSRPEDHTFVVDFYRHDPDAKPVRMVEGQGGEGEAIEYGICLCSLLQAITDYESEGIPVDIEISAVDVRDQVLDNDVEDPLAPWREEVEAMVIARRNAR